MIGCKPRTAVAAALVISTSGCAVGIPRVHGTPVAPAAPNRTWRPPDGAQVRDSLRSGTLPPQLAARVRALTLPEIVDLALRSNPATRESWAQAMAYADAYGAARASYFPILNATAPATRAEQPTSGSTTLAGPRSTFAPSISLGYTLLDFGARSGTVTSARETAYAMSFTHNVTIQTTVLAVEQAFYTYVAARAVLEAQELSLREARASYDAAWKRDSVGLATKADVLQARTAVAQAQLAIDTAQAQVQTTRTQLAVAFGLPVTAEYDVVARAEDVDIAEVTQNIQSLVDDALRRRPDLQAANADVRAARADVRAARGAMLPALNLSALPAYTYANKSALAGRSYTLSLGLSVPLFNGFANSYDVARARANVQYALAYAEGLRQSVASQVVLAYYDVQSAARQVRTTNELLASAAAAMEVTQARYRAGVGTIIDLLTVQASLASARAQVARSRWTWAGKLAGLAYAAGALDERGSVDIPLGARPGQPR